MKYLIAVDLEGVHGVVGDRYSGLVRECAAYEAAKEAAELEVNAAVRALFDNGAELVAVWDNHGGGSNMRPEMIDPRAVQINAVGNKFRFDFVKDYGFDAILYIGYHAMEGTPGGVLAHTYSSVNIQYVKLNGKPIGELATDSYICESYGIAPIFIACDDACKKEMQTICPDITAVITKYGKSRNTAVLREREDVLRDIYRGVCEAVKKPLKLSPRLPEKPTLEVRYTRAEFAEEMFEKAKSENVISVEYGEDTHTLLFEIERANQLPKYL